MKNKKWLKGAAVLLIAVMAFAGCSGGGSSNRAEKALSEFLSKVDSADNFDEAAFNEIVEKVTPESFATVLKDLSSEVQSIALQFTSSELIGAASGFFSASPGGDFSYELNSEGNGIIINRYTGRNPFLVFPSEIEGFPVVQIGNGGVAPFGRDSFLVSVFIPEGVKIIGNDAFGAQQRLVNVNLPSTLIEIRSTAFNGASALSKIEFPNALAVIGREAFRNSGLINVDLSKTAITLIPEGAFRFTGKLQTVKLPDAVTTIEQVAFHHSNLSEINFPASITGIGFAAFAFCPELHIINIPDNITSIQWLRLRMERMAWGPTNMTGLFDIVNVFQGCGKLQIAARQRLQALGYTGSF
jgi:hypothetical protein